VSSILSPSGVYLYSSYSVILLVALLVYGLALVTNAYYAIISSQISL